MKECRERNGELHPGDESINDKPIEETKIYGRQDLTPPEGYVRIQGLLVKIEDSASSNQS